MHAIGTAAILAAVALWGSTGTVAHFGPAGASPLSVGAARIVVGGGLLLAIALCAASTAGYQLSFFSAVRATGVAVGGGAVLLLPVPLAGHASWLLTVPGVLVTAQLGIMTTAVAYVLYGRGLRTMVGLALAVLIVPGGRDSRRPGLPASPGASTPPGRTPLTPA